MKTSTYFQLKFYSLLLLFLITNHKFAFGQADSSTTDTESKGQWKRGFVVLNNNDTLVGSVKKRSKLQSNKVDFRDSITNEKIPYTVDDLRSFTWNGELYIPVFHKTDLMGDGVILFLKTIVYGYAKLFYFDGDLETNQSSYLVKKKGEKPIELNVSMFGLGGRKKLAKYFSEDEILSKKITDADFDVAGLEKNVIEYNEWRRSQKDLNDIK